MARQITQTITINGIDVTINSLSTLRDRIDELKKRYENFNQAQRENAKSGGLLLARINELESVYTSLSQIIEDTDTNTQQTTNSLGEMKKRLEDLNKELQNLDPDSIDFKKVSAGIAQLSREIQEAEKNTRTLTPTLDAFIQKGNEINAAFNTSQSILTLFGEKSQDVEKIMTKLGEAMNVTKSIQELHNQLISKGSTANTLYNKSLKMLSPAFGGATTAARIFSAALSALGIGLVVAALGYLISNFDKIKKVITDAFPSLKNFGKYMIEAKAIAVGVGAAIIETFTTISKVISRALDFDFSGALEEIENGFNIAETYNKAYHDQTIENEKDALREKQKTLAKDLDEKIKNNEAKYGADWKYTKAARELYDSFLNAQIASYQKDSEEYKEALREKDKYEREYKEHNSRRAGAGNTYKQDLDAYKKALQSFQSETQQMEFENEQQRIDTARNAANKIIAVTQEELDARNAAIEDTYKAQEELNAKYTQKETDAINKQYEQLVEAAQKAKQNTEELEAERQNRLTQLEEKAAKEAIHLHEEKQERLRQSNEKYIQDREKDLNYEAALVDNLYKEIEMKLGDLNNIKRNKLGFIDVDAMRQNIADAGKELQKYKNSLEKAHDGAIRYYDEMIAKYAEDTETQKKFMLEKQNAELEYAQKKKDIENKITENTQQATNIQSTAIKDATEKINRHIETIMTAVNSVFETMNTALESEIEAAQEKYDTISEKHDELVDKVQESNDRITSLQEEAKTAQGGRLVVIQEQLSHEMEAHKELADQEKQLAKEKEKAEADKEKLEKQQKKRELQQQLIMTVANTAMAINKAVAASPITFGMPWSAYAAVTGALQAATISKQMSKLADGGMLYGKSHTQGGMRIEGTNIEVEGGEYVVNKLSTRKNLGLVHYINSQQRQLTASDINSYFNSTGSHKESPGFKTMFAAGGILPSEDIMNTYETDPTLQAIEAIDLQPIVSVVDIANVQKNLTTVTDWTNTASI